MISVYFSFDNRRLARSFIGKYLPATLCSSLTMGNMNEEGIDEFILGYN